MAKHLHNRFYQIILLSDMMGVRFMLSLSAILWGAFLLWPGSTFPEAIGSATCNERIYSLMAQVATENEWGVLFLAQGVYMFAALIFDSKTKITFLFDCCLGCFLWSFASVLCFAALQNVNTTYSPPAILAANIVCTITSWWVLVRYAVDNRKCCNDC